MRPSFLQGKHVEFEGEVKEKERVAFCSPPIPTHGYGITLPVSRV